MQELFGEGAHELSRVLSPTQDAQRLEDGTPLLPQQINRMKELLEDIERAHQELASIQHLHPTYSIYRVCEPAAEHVRRALGKEVRW